MKKQLVILLALAMVFALLTAMAEATTWTCEFCNKKNGGRFCTSCGRSKQEATDKGAAACFHGEHDWLPATRERPQTCSRCGLTRGEKLPQYQVGDIFTFGHYEQDNDLTNGKEPIEWIILEVESDGSLILLSRFALDCKPYNTNSDSTSWHDSSLRNWLNREFCKDAFSWEEKEYMKAMYLESEENPAYGIDSEGFSLDRVWLLSINEITDKYAEDQAYSYFTDNKTRMCVPTKYALAQGSYQSNKYAVDDTGTCWWWLRSYGHSNHYAADVNSAGSIGSWGYNVETTNGAVRPAIRVQPNKYFYENEEISVGKIISFGSYEQDNDNTNGKEPIEWIVLELKSDGSIMLISAYGLDCKPFNNKNMLSWENCSLREWLNNDFYNEAFGVEEKTKIRAMHVDTENNETIDEVTLLSKTEALGYFNNRGRKCIATPYAMAQAATQSGGQMTNDNGCCEWWLRSFGISADSATFVRDDGNIDYHGYYAFSNISIVVRPVICIKLGFSYQSNIGL